MLSFCIFIGLTSCENKNGREADSITIYGTVIDQSIGSSLYNVFISEKNGVGGSTVTGADGSYEFTLPLDGTSNSIYYLVASKDGYVSAEYELKMSDVDKNRRVKVNFQLAKAKELLVYTGKVISHASGNVIDQARITYYRVFGTTDERQMYTFTETNSEGVYRIELSESDIPHVQNYKVIIEGVWAPYFSEAIIDGPEILGKIITVNFQVGP